MTSVARVCTVENCERVHRSKGLCDKHYQAQRRTGQVFTRGKSENTVRPDGTVRTCRVGECGDRVHCRDLCLVHYRRSSYYKIPNRDLDRFCRAQTCPICLDPLGLKDLVIDHDHACCPENGRSCGGLHPRGSVLEM